MKRGLLFLCLAAPLAAQNDSRAIEYGAEVRVRNENWNNIFDWNDSADDQRNQIRWRFRSWMKAPVTKDIDVSLGIASETNQILIPSANNAFDEVILENATVNIKKLFVKGLSLSFGRQNLMKGEGFVFLEGNPYDGSRSIYVNMADLAYAWKKSKIEFIGISDPRVDRYLPRINDKHRQLVEWNEQALGAYYTSNDVKNLSLEGYYFYKKEYGDIRPKTNPQYQPDRFIWTAGGRAVRKLPQGFSLTGEFAAQWGHERPSTSLRGNGGYGYLKKTFGQKGRHNLQGGYWHMSGDDPKTTTRNEGWDPLFSRWPKWSELYIYSQFREKGVAYWTNTGMWQGEMNYLVAKPLNLRLTYYRMNSYQPFAGSQAIYSSGTVRGNMYQARGDLSVGKHWKGHVLWEYMQPGSFYRGSGGGWFLRFETIYTYAGRIPI